MKKTDSVFVLLHLLRHTSRKGRRTGTELVWKAGTRDKVYIELTLIIQCKVLRRIRASIKQRVRRKTSKRSD
jgi:hypothetical protein